MDGHERVRNTQEVSVGAEVSRFQLAHVTVNGEPEEEASVLTCLSLSDQSGKL